MHDESEWGWGLCVGNCLVCASNCRGDRLFVGGAQGDARMAKQDERRRSVPLQRYGSSNDIAATIALPASEGAAYITGQNIRVDGGLMRSI